MWADLPGSWGDMDDIPAFIKEPTRKRAYAHFDLRCTFASKSALVKDPHFVAGYAFYPLIEKPLRRMKQGEDGKPFNKPRPIRYAAHLDRCIYQYYAGLLNEKYNATARRIGIDDSSIAYRTNKKGMSNCGFAALAFSKMRELGTCYVYAGDFEDFFETLDHRYLKQRIKSLFDDGHIPNDYYHVLKNATRYSVWKIESLLDYHGLPHTKSGVRRLNHKARVLDPTAFKALVKKAVCQPWKETERGIPQGLPVSGVLANIYMLEFDKKMSGLANTLGGMYMRYSDDFIFICPTEKGMRDAMAALSGLQVTVPSVRVHPEKTKAFCYKDGTVTQLLRGQGANAGHLSSHIDYLGFSFDGTSVRLRQRTVGRYYRRMYRRLRELYSPGVRPSKKRVEGLYLDFSDWGSDPSRNRKVREKLKRDCEHGNFLTYAHRSQDAFPGDPIAADFTRHKYKIRHRAKRLLEGEG